MKTISLSQGKVALVDDEDFALLSQYKWSAAKGHNNYYAVRGVGRGKKLVKMHRFVLKPKYGMMVDHIDRNGLNNQRSNLRLSTNSQNQANRSNVRGCANKFKGVYKEKGMKNWRARIESHGKKHNIGYFQNEVDAAKAYNYAAKLLFGNFAYLNPI